MGFNCMLLHVHDIDSISVTSMTVKGHYSTHLVCGGKSWGTLLHVADDKGLCCQYHCNI